MDSLETMGKVLQETRRVVDGMIDDQLGDDYKGAFAAASDAAFRTFSEPGVLQKVVVLPFGEMPAGTALDIAIFDVAIHTWDLAKGSGQSTELDPEVLDAAYSVARVMLTDEWRASGSFGSEVMVPDGAPVQDKLAGLAGRTP